MHRFYYSILLLFPAYSGIHHLKFRESNMNRKLRTLCEKYNSADVYMWALCRGTATKSHAAITARTAPGFPCKDRSIVKNLSQARLISLLLGWKEKKNMGHKPGRGWYNHDIFCRYKYARSLQLVNRVVIKTARKYTY